METVLLQSLLCSATHNTTPFYCNSKATSSIDREARGAQMSTVHVCAACCLAESDVIGPLDFSCKSAFDERHAVQYRAKHQQQPCSSLVWLDGTSNLISVMIAV